MARGAASRRRRREGRRREAIGEKEEEEKVVIMEKMVVVLTVNARVGLGQRRGKCLWVWSGVRKVFVLLTVYFGL